jgi:AmmeMemoRadiSam system protein B/AmmeMemoRadiSam system protein A
VKYTIFVLILAVTAAATAATRRPAVAGAFYPGDAAELRQQVESLLAAATRTDDPVRALVVPHAGYAYSGATAAKAFANLQGSDVRRVILLGPSHHVGYGGGALPAQGISSFGTPLGAVEVDVDAVAKLRTKREFQGPVEAHDPEHSLEVELPFLQIVAPRARIVPVLVGFETDRVVCRRMASALSELLDEQTVVVVSSDFTHHGARYGYEPFAGTARLGDELLELGRSTAERVAASDADGFWFQVETSGDTVCGRRPIAVLGELLEHGFDGSGRLIDVTTSGHVSGNWDLSVTYAAVSLHGSWHEWREAKAAPRLGELSGDQHRALLDLARATLETHLEHGGSLAHWFEQKSAVVPSSLAGAFVTVNNTGARARQEGRLRACMGVIEAGQPIVDAVIRAAVSAAHDPRFPELRADELSDVELEVSILSPATTVSGPQAIIVGTHGVVLSKGRRRAVFLPQVAPEQGWDRDTMLDNLARKAGLPEDGWRHGAVFEVFTAQVFSEDS